MSQLLFSQREFQLLKKELEATADALSSERLERAADVDKIKIELETMRKTLEEFFPDFIDRYNDRYTDVLQKFSKIA